MIRKIYTINMEDTENIIYLDGFRNNTKIKLEKRTLKQKNNHVLIDMHGLFGSSNTKGSKSELLGEKVIENQLAHVIHYSSSRNWE